MKLKRSFFIVLLLCISFLKPLAAYEILFLSAPRCGTYWCLYGLCHILNRQVIVNRGPAEVNVFDGLFADNQDGFIYAAHNPKDLWIKKNGDEQDYLILIVRNYREALIRNHGKVEAVMNEIKHQSTFNWMHDYKNLVLIQPHNHYFNNLRCYDVWDPSKRLLIYYEELLSDPEKVYEKVIDLLGIDKEQTNLDRFLEDIEEHKAKCLEVYASQGGSQSKGQDFLYHSKRIGMENSRMIDAEVEKLFPYFFNKYLKHYKLDDPLFTSSNY